MFPALLWVVVLGCLCHVQPLFGSTLDDLVYRSAVTNSRGWVLCFLLAARFFSGAASIAWCVGSRFVVEALTIHRPLGILVIVWLFEVMKLGLCWNCFYLRMTLIFC